jgi:fatty acid desaturase
MKRLSILIWLALFTAVLPLLALPLWLMKWSVFVLAVVIAVLGYSVFRDFYADDHSDSQPEASPNSEVFEIQLSAEEDESETYHNADKEQEEDIQAREPVNITNTNRDRFASLNSYKRRSHRLGK